MQQTITIINKLGLHARASAKFVKTAASFASEITITHGEKTVNAKSILGVMMLAASCGTKLLLSAEGADAKIALQALADLVAQRFGESE